MMFFACSPCGGSASSTLESTGDPTESTEYPALGIANALKLLGVPAGGTQQAFLSGSTLPGLVWMSDEGVAEVETTPELNLPAATSSGFTQLLVGTNDSPSKWQMFRAPATGSYLLAAVGGEWEVQNIGALPGFSTLGMSGPTATPLVMLGIRETAPGVWEAAKLTTAAFRVLVGDGDGISVKSLPVSEYLYHPLANFMKLEAQTFEHLDAGGALEASGISLGAASANNKLAIYNTSTKKFQQAPPRVALEVFSNNNHVISDNGQWQSLTPHCIIPSTTFNYPNVFIVAFIRLFMINVSDPVVPNDFNMDFGLFVDGTGPVKTWDVKGAKDNTIQTLCLGLALGAHTLEIRCLKTFIADQDLWISQSHFSVFTVM